MKESGNKFISHKETDDAIMNFVSRQAQEAILDPNLPEFYKDEIVEAAVGTIVRIAEKRNSYNAKPTGSNTQNSHSSYTKQNEGKKPKRNSHNH